MNKVLWPEVTDDDYVERLIHAIQGAVASIPDAADPTSGMTEVIAPDLANALLFILAGVLERSPAAATPTGARRLAEAAGRELNQLVREARRIRLGDGSA